MTVLSTVAICSAAAALLAITASHQIVADPPKTEKGGLATPASHCEQAAQWTRTAPLSPIQATDPSARCEASPFPMSMNIGWEQFVRSAGR